MRSSRPRAPAAVWQGAEFDDAAKKAKRPAALLVNRDGNTRFATLRLDN